MLYGRYFSVLLVAAAASLPLRSQAAETRQMPVVFPVSPAATSLADAQLSGRAPERNSLRVSADEADGITRMVVVPLVSRALDGAFQTVALTAGFGDLARRQIGAAVSLRW